MYTILQSNLCGPPLYQWVLLLEHLFKQICVDAGWYKNQEVAVKVSQPFYEVREQSSKEDAFLHEVWAYQQLQQMPEIYGTLVPELLAFVRLPHDVLLLVMTKQGPSLSDYVNDNGNLPTALKETVLSSLARLHSHGVVHGSPRFDNITLKPGSSDVCFIDLQRVARHKYAWPRPDSFGEKWDSSLEDWRELTSADAEAIDRGAYRLAQDIMTAVAHKVQEYMYVCMLLEQDYTETRDCTTLQRDNLRWAIKLC